MPLPAPKRLVILTMTSGVRRVVRAICARILAPEVSALTVLAPSFLLVVSFFGTLPFSETG